MKLFSSYQPALELNNVVEDIHYLSHLKCYLFYIPQFFNKPIQQKMRTSAHQRKELRKTILQKLLEADIKLSYKQQKTLCDINYLPSMPNGFISISHCPGLKGFAYSINKRIDKQSSNRKNDFLGLDVELTSRVTTRLVSFLSCRTELDNMPNPSCLWTAKEAAFKCLYPQNTRISQITIKHWNFISSNLYQFDFSTLRGVYGRGYSYIWKQWTIAIAHT